MTTIRLHGLLAKKFGSIIRLHLGNLKHIISAIDSIKDGFRNKLKEFSDKGYNYIIQKDEEENIIHLMPLIGGSGKTAMIVVAVILIVVAIIITAGAVAAAAPEAAAAASATAATATAATAATVTIAGITISATLAANIGLFLLSTGLSMLYSAVTMKSPQAATSYDSSMGGQTMGSEAIGKSYVFSSLNNAESQGSTIPLGYGKMKIGSKLIHFGMKQFPTNISTSTEFTKNEAYSVFSNYLAG